LTGVAVADKQRSPWNFNRFWQTIAYFEVIPFLSCLQKLWQGNKPDLLPIQLNPMETILVAGATGGVGKRVVKLLQQKNYRVRALVRNAQRAKEILGEGETLELFEGDITIPETLTPQLMQGVNAIICCTGTRVQPVEGDTPSREKYYQGIKFYLPEVVDVPEVVEYRGMKNLVDRAKQYFPQNDRAKDLTIFDFANPTATVQNNLKNIWGAVDDVVMGGVSESSLRLNNNRAVFSGVVSVENNGGFASVRTRNFDSPLDLSEYQGIRLRLQGDGKRYKFIIRCEGKWDGISYCYSFDTIYNYPQTITIPFRDLIPVFRAKTVPSQGYFDPSRVYSMQLMLSKFEYDGALNPKFEAGFFGLEIESIEAYGGKAKPQIIAVSSAGVTRPGRPNLNLAEEPPAVRLNDQLGGILTWKLRGEEVIRESGLNYTIVRPCALTEKAGDKLLEFDRGDNLRGQVSREAIAELCVAALTLPEAVGCTFEVRETEMIGQNNWQKLFAELASTVQSA
jgi:uncharacterized protein YbjT (DUF2867 family)